MVTVKIYRSFLYLLKNCLWYTEFIAAAFQQYLLENLGGCENYIPICLSLLVFFIYHFYKRCDWLYSREFLANY